MKYFIGKSNDSSSGVLFFTNLKLPRAPGIFIAEGEKVVTRLLESHLEIVSLYLTEEHFESKRARIDSHEQASEAEVILASKKEMEQIVGFPLHQGILAAAKIPPEISLDQLLWRDSSPHLFVILDSIADAENMGSLYRTSFGMRVTAVIVDASSVSPWIRRAVRVSLGAVFELPTVTAGSLSDTIAKLRKRGTKVLATTLNSRASHIWDTDLKGDIAFVFGSEGYGIRPQVISACDKEVTFPMPKGIDSFNVSVAQGLFLYEAARQRVQG